MGCDETLEEACVLRVAQEGLRMLDDRRKEVEVRRAMNKNADTMKYKAPEVNDVSRRQEKVLSDSNVKYENDMSFAAALDIYGVVSCCCDIDAVGKDACLCCCALLVGGSGQGTNQKNGLTKEMVSC